jgi:hypothetical protein
MPAEPAKPQPRRSLCYEFPVGGFMVNLVLPRHLSQTEADRLCAFIQTLVIEADHAR